tara:strand:+ start:74 stop:382 length:309 start_codon:yes stop_codon:yes gene_type:complete
MDTSNKFIIPVQQYADTEDYFIEIPQEITNELNWQEGDEIDWQIDKQGIILRKIEDSNSTKEEHQQTYYDSESEGKDFDTYYDDYIEATNEETFGTESIEFP